MGVEAALILAAAGTGVAAYSSYQSGKAAEAEAKNQQILADRNAAIEDQNAQVAEEAARQNARDNREKANSLKAQNRAWLAETGGGGGGSTVRAAAFSAQTLEKDIQTQFVNDITVANTYREQAINDRLQGQATLIAGKNAKKSSYYKAGSTLLTGASKVYDIGYDNGVW